MAKTSTIQYFDRFYTEPTDLTSLWMLSATKTKVVCEDPSSHNRVILEGENLVVERGMIVGGTIEDMTVGDTHGKPFYTFSDFKVDSRLVAQDTMFLFTVEVLQRAILGNNKFIGSSHGDDVHTGDGNDILLGKGGDDKIGGSAGTDIMTGGGGNDTFDFATGDGKDTITDFDAEGGAGFQDLIGADFTAVVSITKSGKNTVIDFGHGDTLTLLDIKPSHIDNTDFVTV